MTRPAVAISGEEAWISEGAHIDSTNGRVDGITFGQRPHTSPAKHEGLGIHWSGFDDRPTGITFDVLVSGSNTDSDYAKWTENQMDRVVRTGPTAILELEDSDGNERYSWRDIFGSRNAADLSQHPHISLGEFDARGRSGDRGRILDVNVVASVPNFNLVTTAGTEAIISVSDRDATVSTGGRGTFEIESETEI